MAAAFGHDVPMGDDVHSRLVVELWARIVAWLEQNAPRSADALVSSGASDADLALAETSTGLEWTDELRAWFTVQGGAGRLGTLHLHGLLEPLALQESMAARDMHLALWSELVEDEPALREGPGRAGTGGLAFQPEFIPIADDPGGSVLVVDLRPGSRRGCVGTVLDDGGATFQELGWPSVAAWLEEIAAALTEAGRSSQGVPVVEDGRLAWRLAEADHGDVDIPYGGSYVEVLDVEDPSQPPADEAQIAAFLARIGARPDVAPPGWTGPWPPPAPEMPLDLEVPDGEHGVLVASVGFGWSMGFGGERQAPATTRLRLSYRREDDPRAASTALRTPQAVAPTQIRRSPRRGEPAATLQSVWAEVVAWLDQHAPATAAQVAASTGRPTDVAAAEAAAEMDVPWPDDLRWWFTVAPHLVQNEEGDHLLGPYRAMTAAESVHDIEMWRGIEAGYADELETSAGSSAGEPVGTFCPEFVPIASEGSGVELVVDLRPGPQHGCVLIYSAEDGARMGAQEGDEDSGWPSLTALVLDLLCALADGDHFEWCTAEVSTSGEVLWPFDEDAVPAPAPLTWTWLETRDRVAMAWAERDDEAVWAAIVDALLTARTLSTDEVMRATWTEPPLIGDPVIDAVIAGAARHACERLGANGDAWHWDRQVHPSIPLEAGVDSATAEQLHHVTPIGFHSVGLLLDPSRLPY